MIKNIRTFRAWLNYSFFLFFFCTVIFSALFCSQAQAPNLTDNLRLSNGMGVSIHFTKPRYGEMKMLAESGLQWIRMDLYWHRTELRRGVYDFSEYDVLLSNLQKYKIRPILILVYTNPLYDNNLSPHTEEGRKAFSKWAVAAAKHFKNRGILWEVYNEPDAGGWSPKANHVDYIKLALSVGNSFHLSTPNELLIGPATAIQLPFLEACFKSGLLKYWAAISIHPYRKEAPELVTEDYRQLRLLINRYSPPGKVTPIISGEWGYPSSTWRPWRDIILNETIQGKYVVRQFLINFYNRIPLSIWYDWQDDGSDPKSPEHNFGLVRHNYDKTQNPVMKPKPSYYAVQTLTRILNGMVYDKRLTTKDSLDYILRFTNPKTRKSILAVWSSSNIPHTISLPIRGKYRIVTYTGQEKEVVFPKNSLSLTLSDAPQYLIQK
jgi:polysaccharide biosynthesis protein PslG